MANLLPLLIGGVAAAYFLSGKKEKAGKGGSPFQRGDTPSGDGVPTSGIKDGWSWRVGEVSVGDFGIQYVSEIQAPNTTEWLRVHGEPLADFTASRNLALESIAIARAEAAG